MSVRPGRSHDIGGEGPGLRSLLKRLAAVEVASRSITARTSISDGTTLMAAIDRDAAIAALHADELPCSDLLTELTMSR